MMLLIVLSLAQSFGETSQSLLVKIPASGAAAPITAPLVASPSNPNYFQDASGTPIALCGSQTWNTLQDWGTNGSPQTLDFNAFVSFLTAHGHNFTLLWTTELPKFSNLPVTATSPPDFTVSVFPWMRTGPGNATDGKLKFAGFVMSGPLICWNVAPPGFLGSRSLRSKRKPTPVTVGVMLMRFSTPRDREKFTS